MDEDTEGEGDEEEGPSYEFRCGLLDSGLGLDEKQTTQSYGSFEREDMCPVTYVHSACF